MKNAAGKNAKRTNGFDSRAEYRRYQDLTMLQRGGVISNLERQVKIPLMGRDGPILTRTGRKMVYVADFTYTENGEHVVEDVKGYPSEVYLLKKAILAAQGIIIRETK